MDMMEILNEAVRVDASDIFLVAGSAPGFKVNGTIEYHHERLMPEDTKRLIAEIYEMKDHRDMEPFIKQGEDDFSFSIPHIGRFRVNAYFQRGSQSAVLRIVKFTLPDPQALHIPESVLRFSQLRKGLVLITGSAGSGKTTTLACLIDEINKQRNGHIITIEDPIEYLHSHKKSIVSQREINHDTTDYLTALRAALREAPDVVLVGEMRDLETIQTVLQAAETGHLVLSTLHTTGAANTINRIIDVFPPDQQQQIRVQLSMVLEAVVSQQLIPTKSDKMWPAFEIMIANSTIRSQIRDGKIHQIDNSILSGGALGMETMDTSIEAIYKQGLITSENALMHASNPDALKRKL